MDTVTASSLIIIILQTIQTDESSIYQPFIKLSSEMTGKRLLAIGNYGVCLHPKDDPNDGNGIGRVVREVKPDGSLGPIFFLYLNHDFV